MKHLFETISKIRINLQTKIEKLVYSQVTDSNNRLEIHFHGPVYFKPSTTKKLKDRN